MKLIFTKQNGTLLLGIHVYQVNVGKGESNGNELQQALEIVNRQGII